MAVFKFGGSSLRDKDAFLATVAIIEKYRPEVVVASATYNTTNQLEELFQLIQSNDPTAKDYYYEIIHKRHVNIARDLGILDLFKFEITDNEFFSPVDSHNAGRKKDQILAIGELMSSQILSHLLAQRGNDYLWRDVRDLLITNNEFGKADPLLGEIRKKWPGKTPFVTQGFIGRTLKGETTTLGREGSDFSAVLLAWAGQISKCVIWTDVAGIATIDPRLAPGHYLKNLSYGLAETLAYQGAKVLFPRTLRPARLSQIEVIVASTFLDSGHTQPTGTIINDCPEQKGIIQALAIKDTENGRILSLVGKELFLSDLSRLDRFLPYMELYSQEENFIGYVIDRNFPLEEFHKAIWPYET